MAPCQNIQDAPTSPEFEDNIKFWPPRETHKTKIHRSQVGVVNTNGLERNLKALSSPRQLSVYCFVDELQQGLRGIFFPHWRKKNIVFFWLILEDKKKKLKMLEIDKFLRIYPLFE